MLFSSLEFLYAFLPLLLLVYFLAPRGWKNGVLLIASLFFYFYGEQKRAGLLLLSVAVSYLGALVIDRKRGTPWAKVALVGSLAIQLGLLGIFKYADFVLSTINGIFNTQIPMTGILLPIGISFYTFQALSYVVDVYRNDVPVQKNPIQLATYVALFPQLIAGPIVRYGDVARELQHREHSLSQFGRGAERFVVGLSKKILIANVLYELCVDFRAAENPSVLLCWLYAVAYTLHLYFDFSGYSDMAIGLGRMLGFRFPENFRYPFAAASISDFWRRWHMTLGSWFRDYVYFPLGGSRVSRGKLIRNLFVVWFLTGLWHGAAWTFALWGLFFGLLLGGEKLLWGTALERAPRWVGHLYVVPLLLVSFVIFDSADLAQLGQTLAGMVGLNGAGISDSQALYLLGSYGPVLVAALVLSLPVGPALATKLERVFWWPAARAILAPVTMAALLLACTAFLVDGSFNPFLYFRF